MTVTADTITDAQIDAVERQALLDEDDALAKECRITRMSTASKTRFALAMRRVVAAFNRLCAAKEAPP